MTAHSVTKFVPRVVIYSFRNNGGAPLGAVEGKVMDAKMVDFSNTDGTLVCALACEIDHHTARHLRESIDRELFLCRPQLLVLDFSCVRFMDSSGIALILGRVETAEAVGATVCLRGLCHTLMKLVRLSGLDRVKSLTISKGEG